MNKLIKGYAALVIYILTIVAANVALTWYGIIPVGFGLMAPAGSFFAGIAFIMRDVVQETLGKWYSVGAIIIGAGISAVLSSTDLAIASGVTFLLSEFLDFLVYTPLRTNSFLLASFVSNVVGLIVDTFLFLYLAKIPFEFATGQIYAKTISTVVFIVLYLIISTTRLDLIKTENDRL